MWNPLCAPTVPRNSMLISFILSFLLLKATSGETYFPTDLDLFSQVEKIFSGDSFYPTNVRYYVSHKFKPISHKHIADVEIRWDEPLFSVEPVYNYTIFYAFRKVLSPSDKNEKQWTWENITVPFENKSLVLENRGFNENFLIQLQANAFEFRGNKTKTIVGTCKTQNPVAKNLIASSNAIYEYDRNFKKFKVIYDSHEHGIGVNSGSEIESLAFVGYQNILYWIDRKQPATMVHYSLDTGKETKIFYVSDTAEFLQVDWVGQQIYWAQNGRDLWHFDLVKEIFRPNRLIDRTNQCVHFFSLPIEKERIVSFVVDPLSSALITMVVETPKGNRVDQFTVEGELYTIYSTYELPENHTVSDIDCITKCQTEIGDIEPSITLDIFAEKEKRFILHSYNTLGYIEISTLAMDGCSCQKLPKLELSTNYRYQLPVVSMTVDSKSVSWIANPKSDNALANTMFISVNKSDGGSFGSYELPLSSQQAFREFSNMLSYSQQVQPLPPEQCLIPRNYTEMPELQSKGHNYITLHFPAEFQPDKIDDEKCGDIIMPTLVLTLCYSSFKSSAMFPSCGSTINEAFSFKLGLNCTCVHDEYKPNYPYINVTYLKPYTKYVFQAAFTNFFSYQSPALSDPVFFSTTIGAPGKMEKLSVFSLMPSKLLITFRDPVTINGPEKSLRFKILWCDYSVCQKGNHSELVFTPDPKVYDRQGYHSLVLSKLKPNTTFKVGVVAFHEPAKHLESSKLITTATTYPLPQKLKVEKKDCCSLTLLWFNENWNLCRTVTVTVFKIGSKEPVDTQIKSPSIDRRVKFNFRFENLESFTKYRISLKILYLNAFNDPEKSKFSADSIFEDNSLELITDAGPPDAPMKPVIYRNSKLLRIEWQKPKLNCPLDTPVKYLLQSCIINDINYIETNCTEVYFGNKTSILLHTHNFLGFFFRVQVKTPFGKSSFSLSSNSSRAYLFHDESQFFKKEAFTFFGLPWKTHHTASVACVVTGMFLLIFVSISCRNWCAIASFKKKRLSDPANASPVIPIPMSPTRSRSMVLQYAPFKAENNILYYTGTNQTGHKEFDTLQGLSIIRYESIQIGHLIGSGAFGEVYSALSNQSDERIPHRDIAVKFVNSNAGPEQKQEFIQEAILMRNFEHPNIVQVYGICTDSEPIGIIMELMQCDLLTFLRRCRLDDEFEDEHRDYRECPPCTLTLVEQIMFAIDIANGCNYLSEHHMLHRDLAARNCLVSQISDPGLKSVRANCEYIVKVGDFGLARDVYKQEYYRKTGNALMPVRWMSPEALIDGMFTSQSDVWSYGVVFWEIMTLGNQPYPAKDNVDVLYYVKSGGRLEPPENCIPELGDLMDSCWNLKPSKRPTFKQILDYLDALIRAICLSPGNGADSMPDVEEADEDFGNRGFYSPIYVSSSDVNKPQEAPENSESTIVNLPPENIRKFPVWSSKTPEHARKLPPWSSTASRRFFRQNSTLGKTLAANQTRDGLTDDISSILSSAVSVAAVSTESYIGKDVDDLDRSYMKVYDRLRDAESGFENQRGVGTGSVSYDSVYLPNPIFDDMHEQHRETTDSIPSVPMSRKPRRSLPPTESLLGANNSYKPFEQSPLVTPNPMSLSPINKEMAVQSGYSIVLPKRGKSFSSPSQGGNRLRLRSENSELMAATSPMENWEVAFV